MDCSIDQHNSYYASHCFFLRKDTENLFETDVLKTNKLTAEKNNWVR